MSTVTLISIDTRTGHRDQMTLCYPREADPAKGFLSVLSPVGCMSLIGLRPWRHGHVEDVPGGEEGSAKVAEILYQPEASGEYTS